MTLKKISHVEYESCYGDVDLTGTVRFWLKNINLRPGTLYGRIYVETNNYANEFNFSESANYGPYNENICVFSTPPCDSRSKVNAITVYHPVGLITVSVNLNAATVSAIVNYSYEEVIAVYCGGRVLRSLDAPWMEQ